MKKNTGKQKERKERGITLIALVITIVVLIILATVSINAVFSETGIIKKAQEAKELTERTTQNELEGLNNLIDKIMNGNIQELKPPFTITTSWTEDSTVDDWVINENSASFTGKAVTSITSEILIFTANVDGILTFNYSYASVYSSLAFGGSANYIDSGNAVVVNMSAGDTLTVIASVFNSPRTSRTITLTDITFETQQRGFASIGSTTFDNLVDAVNNATEGDTINLLTNCILEEDLTIPSGVTLVIPYDNTFSSSTTDYDATGGNATSAYVELKCNEGVTLTVNGTLIVNAKVKGNGYAEEGVVSGTYGQMVLNGTMQVNGTVYARGYIIGTGEVQVNSGATVYQLYQSMDCGLSDDNYGGTVPDTFEKVYWTKNYYYQNIMTSTTYTYGSALFVQYWTIDKNYKEYLPFLALAQGNLQIIGTSDSFYVMSANSEIKMSYNSNSDKQIIQTRGNITMANELTIVELVAMIKCSVNIVGGNYPYPINGNTVIDVVNGTLTVENDIEMLPGSSITVESGAKIEIAEGADIYLWDVNDFDSHYVYTGNDENGEGHYMET